MMRLRPWILGLALGFLTIGPVMAVAPAADPPGMAMDPVMRQKMMAHIQDFIVMMQNNAVMTPQGLVVLQGNRLLRYGADMKLAQTVTLPLPPAPAVAPPTTPPATPMDMMTMMPALRSTIPTQILTTPDGGLVIVRGQQIIRLDKNFKVLGQTAIPDLPPLTQGEINAICPACQYMMMMGGGTNPPAAGCGCATGRCGCAGGGCTVPAPLVPLLTPPQ